MLLKESVSTICDNSGGIWLKIFHIYGGWSHKSAAIGVFIKGSIQKAKPPRRGFHKYKYRPVRKGFIYKSFFTSAAYRDVKHDGGVWYNTVNNVCLLIRRRFLKGTRVFGICSTRVHYYKFLILFDHQL